LTADHRAVEFRKAGTQDLESVLALERLCGGRWERDHFLKELETSFSLFIVALDAGTIVGYAVAWNVTGEIQLNNIAGHPGSRRRGLCSSVIGRLHSNLASFSPDKFLLEVNENNAAARAFYTSQGFRETGTRKKYYRDDNAVLMEKTL
jgi:ribosomal-protein-alanine N-acetyltransferase